MFCRRISFPRAALWVASAVLALGCLGRSPAVHYFTLGGSVSDAPPDGRVALLDAPVWVVPISLPEYLDRPQMVNRIGTSQIQVDELNRWGGGFRSNVTRALAQTLSARLPSDQVFLDASDSPEPVAYQVSVDIHQFEGGEPGGLVLRARWILREKTGERRAWTRDAVIRQEVSGGLDGLIAAHDAALVELADQIAQRIREEQ